MRKYHICGLWTPDQQNIVNPLPLNIVNEDPLSKGFVDHSLQRWLSNYGDELLGELSFACSPSMALCHMQRNDKTD